MSGNWCAKCWLTKRTTYVTTYKIHLCDQCFDYLVRKDLQALIDSGVIQQ